MAQDLKTGRVIKDVQVSDTPETQLHTELLTGLVGVRPSALLYRLQFTLRHAGGGRSAVIAIANLEKRLAIDLIELPD
eukprot:5065504-Amphidinium_carterae.2